MAYQINKRAHRPRKVSDKPPVKVRIARFLERQGFYVILLVCLGIVGVTAFVTLSGNPSEPQAPQESQVDWLNLPATQDSSDGLDEVLMTTPTPSPTPEPTPTLTPTPTPLPAQTPEPLPSAVPALAQTPEPSAPSETPVPSETPKPASKGSISFPMPVQDGKLALKFADKNLVYSKTLKQWTTHPGIDIAAKEGTSIKAVLGGKVETVEKDAWLGYKVVIAHDNDCKSVYANLKDPDSVKKGQAVNAGDVIGKVGKTALSECEDDPHLHFEFYQKGKTLNPELLINNLTKDMPESE